MPSEIILVASVLHMYIYQLLLYSWNRHSCVGRAEGYFPYERPGTKQRAKGSGASQKVRSRLRAVQRQDLHVWWEEWRRWIIQGMLNGYQYWIIQWNPFSADTIGTHLTYCPDFRISGVSLIRGRIAATGSQSSVHISGVSASRGSTIVEFWISTCVIYMTLS